MAKRHARLCGRVAQTKKIVTAIKEPLEQLIGKEKEQSTTSKDREYVCDDVILCDTELDNTVRTTFEDTRQYSRKHLTRMLDLLFPARRFSDLIRMPLSKESQDTNKIIVMLTQLEKNSNLKQNAGY
jgi:hypothetical protein